MMGRFLTVAQEVVVAPISLAFEKGRSLPSDLLLYVCLESPSFLLIEEFSGACGVMLDLLQLE